MEKETIDPLSTWMSNIQYVGLKNNSNENMFSFYCYGHHLTMLMEDSQLVVTRAVNDLNSKLKLSIEMEIQSGGDIENISKEIILSNYESVSQSRFLPTQHDLYIPPMETVEFTMANWRSAVIKVVLLEVNGKKVEYSYEDMEAKLKRDTKYRQMATWGNTQVIIDDEYLNEMLTLPLMIRNGSFLKDGQEVCRVDFDDVSEFICALYPSKKPIQSPKTIGAMWRIGKMTETQWIVSEVEKFMNRLGPIERAFVAYTAGIDGEATKILEMIESRENITEKLGEEVKNHVIMTTRYGDVQQ